MKTKLDKSNFFSVHYTAGQSGPITVSARWCSSEAIRKTR